MKLPKYVWEILNLCMQHGVHADLALSAANGQYPARIIMISDFTIQCVYQDGHSINMPVASVIWE